MKCRRDGFDILRGKGADPTGVGPLTYDFSTFPINNLENLVL